MPGDRASRRFNPHHSSSRPRASRERRPRAGNHLSACALRSVVRAQPHHGPRLKAGVTVRGAAQPVGLSLPSSPRRSLARGDIRGSRRELPKAARGSERPTAGYLGLRRPCHRAWRLRHRLPRRGPVQRVLAPNGRPNAGRSSQPTAQHHRLSSRPRASRERRPRAGNHGWAGHELRNDDRGHRNARA